MTTETLNGTHAGSPLDAARTDLAQREAAAVRAAKAARRSGQHVAECRDALTAAIRDDDQRAAELDAAEAAVAKARAAVRRLEREIKP